MGAVRMMARAEMRQRWRSVVVIGLLVGLAGGFVLAAATGSRRAATSWDRFAAATDSPEVIVLAPTMSAGLEVVEVAEATPGVEAATGFHWLPLGMDGIDLPDLAMYVSIDDNMGRAVYRPRLLSGRMADPAQPGEITINRALADRSGLKVGDRVAAVALGPAFVPTDGVDQELEVVGVVNGTLDLGDDHGVPVAYLTRAFRDRWLEPIAEPWGDAALDDGGILTPVLVGLTPGADPETVADALTAASPPETTADLYEVDPNVATTIRYTAWAYAALAAGAALATAVAGAQAMGRLVQPGAGEPQVWRALGATPVERTVALALPALGAAGLAVVVAAAGAVAASPLTSTGFPRLLETDRGVWLDRGVLAAGVVAFAVVLAAAAVGYASRAQRGAGAKAPVAAPAWLGLASPDRALGVRAALGWGTDAASRRRARSAVAATALGMLGIGAVVLVSASSASSLETPRAWGFGYDRFVPPADLSGADIDALEVSLLDDPDVGALSVARTGDGSIDGAPLEIQEIEPLRGSALPVLLDGRAPIAPDEVAVGPIFLRRHDLEVGDGVTVVDGESTVHIVGTAAVPAHEGGEFGSVVWLSAGAFERLGIEPNSKYLFLTAAPGVPATRLDRIAGASPPFRPANLDNLEEVGAVPFLLAGFFALLGVSSATHALVVAVRGRRHELAVLRSLGFVRRQVQATVVWQGATTMLVGLALGAPLGLAAGSWLWRQLATSLGTPAGVTVPVARLAALAVGAMVVVLLMAVVPARRAGRLRAADVLRTE